MSFDAHFILLYSIFFCPHGFHKKLVRNFEIQNQNIREDMTVEIQ